MATRAKKPANKPKAPPKPKPPRKWAEKTGAGSSGKVQSTAVHAMTPAGGMVARTLLSGSTGLSGVILELVGEGHVSMGAALSAWQREQDRISNRTWRRPGGLFRMGGQ